MKQKINLHLALVALVALVLTTLGVTRVYYDLFQQQVRKDLRVNAQMLSAAKVFAQGEQISLPSGDLRVTWVGEDGTGRRSGRPWPRAPERRSAGPIPSI